jgi:quercetin dioxygenase-like cupin family protein
MEPLVTPQPAARAQSWNDLDDAGDDVERILEALDLAARQLEGVNEALARAEGGMLAEAERRLEGGARRAELRPLQSAAVTLRQAHARLAPLVADAEARRLRFEREWFAPGEEVITMQRTDIPQVVLSANEIAARPTAPLEPSLAGVVNTILSEHDGTYAGLMRLAADRVLPEHEHRAMGHHMWVVEGAARYNGRRLDAGSYWYAPPGRAHAVMGLAPSGCTIFYVDVPER